VGCRKLVLSFSPFLEEGGWEYSSTGFDEFSLSTLPWALAPSWTFSRCAGDGPAALFLPLYAKLADLRLAIFFLFFFFFLAEGEVDCFGFLFPRSTRHDGLPFVGRICGVRATSFFRLVLRQPKDGGSVSISLPSPPLGGKMAASLLYEFFLFELSVKAVSFSPFFADRHQTAENSLFPILPFRKWIEHPSLPPLPRKEETNPPPTVFPFVSYVVENKGKRKSFSFPPFLTEINKGKSAREEAPFFLA